MKSRNELQLNEIIFIQINIIFYTEVYLKTIEKGLLHSVNVFFSGNSIEGMYAISVMSESYH